MAKKKTSVSATVEGDTCKIDCPHDVVKEPPPSDDSDPARARAIRDQRVDDIIDMMTSGQWHGAKTSRTKAADWGVSMGAVNDYAREASGIIRHSVSGHEEDLRAQLIAGIEHVRSVALGRRKPVCIGKEGNTPIMEVVEDPDCKAALSAYDLQAKLLGLHVTRIDATVTQVAQPWAELSVQEQASRLDTAIAKLCQLRQSLPIPATAVLVSGESNGDGEGQGGDG